LKTNDAAHGAMAVGRTLTLGENAGMAGIQNFFNGEVAEIMVYAGTVSNMGMIQVETYISHKYGVTLALVDQDGDGMPDGWELEYFGNLDYGPNDDPDHDGLTNLQEYQYRTDPLNADTDWDGYFDGIEVQWGTEPLSASSFPRAKISGVLTYTGPQTGTISVAFSTNVVGAGVAQWQTLSAPGVFAFTSVPALRTYWLKAWRDSNGNNSNDSWEAQGTPAVNPVYLDTNVTNADIRLIDPIQIVFEPSEDTVFWTEDGSYDVKTRLLPGWDRSGPISWSVRDMGWDGAGNSSDPARAGLIGTNGVFHFGAGGGSKYRITAVSPLNPACSNSLTLNVVSIENFALSDGCFLVTPDVGTEPWWDGVYRMNADTLPLVQNRDGQAAVSLSFGAFPNIPGIMWQIENRFGGGPVAGWSQTSATNSSDCQWQQSLNWADAPDITNREFVARVGYDANRDGILEANESIKALNLTVFKIHKLILSDTSGNMATVEDDTDDDATPGAPTDTLYFLSDYACAKVDVECWPGPTNLANMNLGSFDRYYFQCRFAWLICDLDGNAATMAWPWFGDLSWSDLIGWFWLPEDYPAREFMVHFGYVDCFYAFLTPDKYQRMLKFVFPKVECEPIGLIMENTTNRVHVTVEPCMSASPVKLELVSNGGGYATFAGGSTTMFVTNSVDIEIVGAQISQVANDMALVATMSDGRKISTQYFAVVRLHPIFAMEGQSRSVKLNEADEKLFPVAAIGQPVTFTMCTEPAGLEDLVSWRGGDDPENGQGASFTTLWNSGGTKYVGVFRNDRFLGGITTIVADVASVSVEPEVEEHHEPITLSGVTTPSGYERFIRWYACRASEESKAIAGLWSPTEIGAYTVIGKIGWSTKQVSVDVRARSIPLAGLSVWMKADTEGVSRDTNGLVSVWSDRSGNGNDFAASGENRPLWRDALLNGQPALTFDGLNDFMTNGLFPTGQVTVLAVRRYAGFEHRQCLLDCRKANAPDGGFTIGAAGVGSPYDRQALFSGVGGTWASGVNTQDIGVLTTNWAVDTLRISSDQTRFWTDAALKVADSNHGAIAVGGPLTLGANGDASGISDAFSGQTAEILVYNAALSNLGLIEVETYLSLKYGIVLNDIDRDGDGMPDGWELAHGLDPDGDDTGLDPDGDGLTNLQEYQKGLDPQAFNVMLDCAEDTVMWVGGGSYDVTTRLLPGRDLRKPISWSVRDMGWDGAGNSSDPARAGLIGTNGVFHFGAGGGSKYRITAVSPLNPACSNSLTLNVVSIENFALSDGCFLVTPDVGTEPWWDGVYRMNADTLPLVQNRDGQAAVSLSFGAFPNIPGIMWQIENRFGGGPVAGWSQTSATNSSDCQWQQSLNWADAPDITNREFVARVGYDANRDGILEANESIKALNLTVFKIHKLILSDTSGNMATVEDDTDDDATPGAPTDTLYFLSDYACAKVDVECWPGPTNLANMNLGSFDRYYFQCRFAWLICDLDGNAATMAWPWFGDLSWSDLIGWFWLPEDYPAREFMVHFGYVDCFYAFLTPDKYQRMLKFVFPKVECEPIGLIMENTTNRVHVTVEPCMSASPVKLELVSNGGGYATFAGGSTTMFVTNSVDIEIVG
ncbi:MAG: hypothetical protein WC381_05105, partial [Kiritimatiellia bacterium]